MNAIKKVRRYIQEQPGSPAARVLGELVTALADERNYPVSELYDINLEAFELAIELMRDWRLDRYYAQRLRLIDTVLAELPGEVKDGD